MRKQRTGPMRPQWYWHQQRAWNRRNWNIYFERVAGQTLEALADKYDVTPVRIGQIFRKRQRAVHEKLWSAGYSVAITEKCQNRIDYLQYGITTA